MSTPARTRVPNAIFPAEAHVAAEAIIAPVNALRTAVAECALDGKLHPLRNAIMRSSAWLLNNALELLKTRPLARMPCPGPENGLPAAPSANDHTGPHEYAPVQPAQALCMRRASWRGYALCVTAASG
jgi:hypothetical protein